MSLNEVVIVMIVKYKKMLCQISVNKIESLYRHNGIYKLDFGENQRDRDIIAIKTNKNENQGKDFFYNFVLFFSF